MRVYTVHERAWSAAKDRDAVLVREGFCWPAALFSVLWAAANGMWRAAAGLALVELALAFVLTQAASGDPSPILVALAVRLVIGWWGNDWRRAQLARGGFVLTAILAAQDRNHAEYRLLAKAAEHSAAAYE